MYSLFQQPPEETSPEPTTTEKTRRWRAAIERLRTLSGRVAARLRASIPDRSQVSTSSLLQRPPEETSPDSTTPEKTQRWRAATERLRTESGRVAARLRTSIPDRGQWNRISVVLAIALALALVFAFHERSVVAHLETQPGMTARPALPPAPSGPPAAQPRSAEEERLAAQIKALNAKLDSLMHAQPSAQPVAQAPSQPVPAKPAPTHARVRRYEVSDVTVIHHVPQQAKPDPRWQKVQDQLDAQGKQIDTQQKQIEATRQAIASTRSDLQGSIAKSHEDVVALQRKGERNYYEFSIDKSKLFRTVGPVGVNLRKANTKDQYVDLRLMVDDRELSKKHLNLYEPVIFYPSGERQPVELVINSISKDHVRGYISAARYRASDPPMGATTAAPPTNPAGTSVPRNKLVESPR